MNRVGEGPRATRWKHRGRLRTVSQIAAVTGRPATTIEEMARTYRRPDAKVGRAKFGPWTLKGCPVRLRKAFGL